MLHWVAQENVSGNPSLVVQAAMLASSWLTHSAVFLAGCYGLYCETGNSGPFAEPKAAHAYEHCKLSGLPDLNHTNPSVLQHMKEVFNHTLATYAPDGLRLDAAGHSDTVSCKWITLHCRMCYARAAPQL